MAVSVEVTANGAVTGRVSAPPERGAAAPAAPAAGPTFNPKQAQLFLDREREATRSAVSSLPAPAAPEPRLQARRALELLQSNNSRELIGMLRGMSKGQQQALVAAFDAMPDIRRMPYQGQRRSFETIALRRLSVADGVFLHAILRNPSSVPTDADRVEAALRQRSPEQVLALYRELEPAQVAQMERDYSMLYGADLHQHVAGTEVDGKRRGGVLSGADLAAYTRLRTGQRAATDPPPPAEQQARERVEKLTRLLGPTATLDLPALEEAMRGVPAAERPAVAASFSTANAGRTIHGALAELVQRTAKQYPPPLDGRPLPRWLETRYEHLRDTWSGTRTVEAVLLDAATGRLPDETAAAAVRRLTPAELADLRPRFEAAYAQRFPGREARGAFERVLDSFSAGVRREIELHAAIGDVYRSRDFAAAEERVRAIWNDERSLTTGGWQEFRNRFINATGLTGAELDESARRFFDGAHDLRGRIDRGHAPTPDDVAVMLRNYRAFGQRLESFYVERGEKAETAAAMASVVASVGFGAVLQGAQLTTRGILAAAVVGATTQVGVTRSLDPQATTQQLAVAFALAATAETAGGVAIRSGVRALQARRAGAGAEPPPVANEPIAAHDGGARALHASYLPARDVPSAQPRYLGRTTYDGREVDVRAFDSGRLEIGDRVFEGRLERDAQTLFFRDERGQQLMMHLDRPDNRFVVQTARAQADRGVIDNQPVTLTGQTVTTRDGRIIGFASTLRPPRLLTRIDPNDPFAAEIGRIMREPGRELAPLEIQGKHYLRTPNVDGGSVYAIDAAGQAYRFENAGDIIVMTGRGKSAVFARGADGTFVMVPPQRGIQRVGSDSLLVDGKLQRLVPTDIEGVVIGRSADQRSLGVYSRAADGTVRPATLEGPARLVATKGDGDLFIVGRGPNGRSMVHDAFHPDGGNGFVIRAEDGTVRYARRVGQGEYAIEDAARVSDGTTVVGGGQYRTELSGVMDNGEIAVVARRVEGEGDGWRVIDLRGLKAPPVIVTPPKDAPLVLRVKGEGSPSAIVERGIVYRAEFAPSDATVLVSQVRADLAAGEGRWSVERRAVLAQLQRAFGNDGQALERALRGTDPAATARLDAALGAGARDRLWRTFGLASESRDPLTYATRVGALADRSPPPAHTPAGAPVGLVDHPDDIAIFAPRGGGLRRATDDEIRTQFARMVPELSSPIRQSEWAQLARPTRVSVDANAGARERVITIERSGVARQRVRVRVPERLEQGVPTPEELAELLRNMPNTALRSFNVIAYDATETASFRYGSQTLRLRNHAATWRGQSPEDRLRLIAHELAGHGLEMNDPFIHRALLLARRLDGIGASRPYGGLNRVESFAVGIEDTMASAVDAARRSPHTARLFWHLLRDEAPTTSPAARRAMLGGTSLALMLGIGLPLQGPSSETD